MTLCTDRTRQEQNLQHGNITESLQNLLHKVREKKMSNKTWSRKTLVWVYEKQLDVGGKVQFRAIQRGDALRSCGGSHGQRVAQSGPPPGLLSTSCSDHSSWPTFGKCHTGDFWVIYLLWCSQYPIIWNQSPSLLLPRVERCVFGIKTRQRA